MNIVNAYKHFKKICIHKYWVCYYCFICHLYWQGIVHDLSKFSLVEFIESVKYYQGTYSPIDACKKDKGYSMAWFHHRGRNKHHYEYWTDNYDSGTTCVIMPYKYALEMICDYLGAGRAYMGKDFTYEKEYSWWYKKSKIAKMHPYIKNFVSYVLYNLERSDDPEGFLRDKDKIKTLYIVACSSDMAEA